MNANTVVAFLRMIAPFVVSVFAAIGVTVDADTVAEVAIIVFGGVLSVYTGWKNNSITAAAQEADTWLHHLKAQEKDGE